MPTPGCFLFDFLFQGIKFWRREKLTQSNAQSVTNHFDRNQFRILTFTIVYYGMTLDQIKPIGHRLENLWNAYAIKDSQTSSQVQESIRNYFRSGDNTLFDRKLKEASNAFVDWRYMYEGREVELNLYFLMTFREVLRATCCQQRYGKSLGEFVESDAKWELDVQTQSGDNLE